MKRMVGLLGLVAGIMASAVGAEEAGPMPWLARGICADRQVRTMPPESIMRLGGEDVRAIRDMGFRFLKLLVNPAVVQNGPALDVQAMAYFDGVIDAAVAERLPVVVCVHPEDEYKRRVVGNAEDFERFLAFETNLGRHLAGRVPPGRLALQLMTEPYGTSPDRSAWNHWIRLQTRLWKALRGVMPGHTLILSSDQAGSVDAMAELDPVDDANVLYSFTFYEPHLFNWQGGTWRDGLIPRLRELPYPSGPDILKDLPRWLAAMPESLRPEAKSQIERYAAERWDRAALAARIDKAVAWREKHGGRPRLWCAEFGCYQAGCRPEDRVRYLRDMRTILEERQIGWSYWSYNEDFSVMTRESKHFWPPTSQTPDQEVLDALGLRGGGRSSAPSRAARALGGDRRYAVHSIAHGGHG
ncbi:glycoside hydrolase family 5 protein [Aquisphaera insulae]|uniref:glycoside hydrolase family 5 protein n=1 Tax=Aquisphaera insulae TaxID=2712864 RepID=UPI0013EBC8A7|nr:cellulase family glycosylhydrolase [Aquisphaera insulae]